MGPQGAFTREIDLEIKEGQTLASFFKKADKTLGLPEAAFKPWLKGRQGAAVLLNGDRVEPEQAPGIVLESGDEISLLSGLAGG